MQAAIKGAQEIGFTVLSISISLIAVFIPILLMAGIVGRLFREFADAARAVFASVLFAARFHEGISPLARIAKEELERGAKKPVRRGESCQ